MVFQIRLFVVLYCKSIFAYGERGMRWSIRHVLFLIVFPLFYVGLQIINRICFLLDYLFYYDYKGIAVRNPIFIIGFPRSGTTHLHRLIAKDDRFTSLRLWEMMFAPSIIQKKFFLWLDRMDRRIGHPLYHVFCKLEDKLFAEARKMHHISLFDPEEDEIVLIHVFASAFQIFLFPFKDIFAFAYFDEAISKRKRARTLAFYKECIQRHLYVFGRDRQYISKNPAFSCKVNSLFSTFPDAKMICMVRTPLEAVPSAISWMTHNLHTFHKTDNKYESEFFINGIGHWYTYPLAQFEKYQKSAWTIETYDNLVTNPRKLIEGAFSEFGIDMSEELRVVLDQANEKAKSYKSAHKYALEDMGLSRDALLVQFKEIFDRFGFDRN